MKRSRASRSARPTLASSPYDEWDSATAGCDRRPFVPPRQRRDRSYKVSGHSERKPAVRAAKVYVFNGEKYLRWDIAQDTFDFEAKIADEWVSSQPPHTGFKNVVSSTGNFADGIDAAVNWRN